MKEIKNYLLGPTHFLAYLAYINLETSEKRIRSTRKNSNLRQSKRCPCIHIADKSVAEKVNNPVIGDAQYTSSAPLF